jgi:hypothetical protein
MIRVGAVERDGARDPCHPPYPRWRIAAGLQRRRAGNLGEGMPIAANHRRSRKRDRECQAQTKSAGALHPVFAHRFPTPYRHGSPRPNRYAWER